jgi:DNA primase
MVYFALIRRLNNFSTMDIQAIKGKVNIFQIAEELGITIDKNTKRACCPFHNDKTPSLQFSESKQIATCFSSKCTAGTMDVIELVKRKNNWDLPQTLTFLNEKLGSQSNSNAVLISKNLISEDERILILTQLFEFFERGFICSKPAKDYAESRKLNHKLIQIGYNSGTFHHSVNLSQDKKNELIGKYEELGLLKKFNSGYSVFGKGCLVFPLRNEKNQIVSFYFREIDPDKSSKHYYLKNRQGLYPNYPQKETKSIIITESVIDAVSLKQSVSNDFTILANYGTEGGKEQIETIEKLESLKEITIFFDGDEAGKKGALKIAEELQKKSEICNLQFAIKIVQTPENEDINGLLEGHPSVDVHGNLEIFNHLLESAKLDSRLQDERPLTLKEEVKNKSLNLESSSLLSLKLKGNLLKSEESLKVTIEAENLETGKKLRDKIELYEYKQVDRFIKAVSEKLCVSENVVDDGIHQFIDDLEQKREVQKMEQQESEIKEKPLNTYEIEQCVNFGKEKGLINNLNNLIGHSGIVGEEKNRLFLFCIASSHKMKKTLHVVVQGSSGSGKTHLIKKVADLMPEERVKRFTRISEKSFYNYGEFDLVNMLIVLEDYDGMKEEAEFALRELQTNEILISSTSKKDEITGEIKSGENKVRGPIASMVATTHGEMYHDNETRVFFITIDETEEQTKKIIAFKNQISAGEINQGEQEKSKLFIQNFIRSLKPLKVKNTWIKHIDLPVNSDQKRRLHSLFEAFCEQITIIHQYQRKRDENGRLITEKKDIELAIDLMFESIVLKIDELNGRLRDFYEKVKAFVNGHNKEYEFTRMEIRHFTKLGNTQIHDNLRLLEEMEYIQKVHSSRHNTHSYKIAFWDNQQALRERIKLSINEQLNNIK